MLAPPLIWIADTPDLIAGFPTLWLWTTLWGFVMMFILVYAARSNAWGLTEDQVPPEIRDRTGAVGFRDTGRRKAADAEVGD